MHAQYGMVRHTPTTRKGVSWVERMDRPRVNDAFTLYALPRGHCHIEQGR
jgi:hypothetical protein